MHRVRLPFFKAYGSSLLHFNLEDLPPDFYQKISSSKLVNRVISKGNLWGEQMFSTLKALDFALFKLEKQQGIANPLEALLNKSFLSKQLLLPKENSKEHLPLNFFFANTNITPFAIFSRALPKKKPQRYISIAKKSNKYIWTLSLKQERRGTLVPGEKKYFIRSDKLEQNVLNALNIPIPGTGVHEELKPLQPIFKWLSDPNTRILYLLALRNSKKYRGKGKIRYTILWDSQIRKKWSVRNPKINFKVEEIFISSNLHKTIQTFLNKKNYDE